jgi:putative FmdB family regulatory protein
MPTYEYRCKSCSYEFEEFQKITDAPLVVCPSCKRHALTRLIAGGAGLVFKGSGFYLTDYKKTSAGKETNLAKKKDTESKAETTPTHPKSETKSSEKNSASTSGETGSQ